MFARLSDCLLVYEQKSGLLLVTVVTLFVYMYNELCNCFSWQRVEEWYSHPLTGACVHFPSKQYPSLFL